ncbi:MAG TPA: acyl-CoA dehydrogenase, partial [Trueperaceae bacterium]|nr:acyl-CoA dehydrogenase [Trueperaceae bacterium]
MQNLIKDIRFNLYEVLNSEKLLNTERYKEHNIEIFDAVIDTAKKIAEDLFAPHNTKADEHEPSFDGENVKLIPETKKAWDAFAKAGFLATSMDEEWGGSQLPEVIARAVYLIFCAANVSTSVYPFLTIGVAELIHSFASQEQKELYLPALLDGRFSGTMALTEPDQGSALADITTTAKLQADGSYLLKGQKIFISAGDHELSENIIHMVLAKIEGAPAGVKGISLFICPKFLLNDDGSLGKRNDLALTGLLHKMGYRNASSTLLSFGDNDNCKAYLIGKAHKGLGYMFLMMNGARIGVGTGAAAVGYAGYSYSLNYAHERKQGRLPSNRDPSSPQLAIIKHADVRRMLLAQKSYVEGSIAICLYATSLLDIQKTGTLTEKKNALALLEFLTPVVKSWPSKYGPKANDLAIQILAGAGYMRDHPVEQYYRDNRLNAIHEGTRGIQAIDLLGRKLTYNKFEYYQAFKD